MKGKRLLLVGGLLAVLLLGWAFSLSAASGIKERQAQAALEKQADGFKEKELYIRALPLYQEALKYDAGSNAQIEAKMLEIYLAQEDADSYVELVEDRASEGTASKAEYLRAAEYYLADNDLDEAMALLKKGMTVFPNGEIEELYEDNRYGYTLRESAAKEIIPTSGNTLMPAFDGEKWGYVGSTGRFVLPAIYDSATPFGASGMAAVSMDGKYYIIVETGEKYGVDEAGLTDAKWVVSSYVVGQKDGKYSYYTMDFENAMPELQYDEMTCNSCGIIAVRQGEKWALVTDTGEPVTDYIYEDVAVNSLNQVFANDRGFVKREGLWYLVDSEGNLLVESGFADAKAPESDGYIAVADSSGKWGFIDSAGELVIKYQYNDAWSFSNHLAAVKHVDTWGYISERGELVIQEPLQDAKPFHSYSAQAVFLNQAAMINLEYKEQ